MEHIADQQVIKNNATSAYFMVFVCAFFFWSHNKNINNTFVKSHVRVALTLHLALLIVLFLSSFRLFDGIQVFGYSLNSIITMVLCLIIFAGILFGAFRAHSGENITLQEVAKKGGHHGNILQGHSMDMLAEEENAVCLAAQIPFIGYIIAPRHKNISVMRDISQLNLITMLVVTVLIALGHLSLGSIVLLIYTIWCVAQSLRVMTEQKMTTLDMSKVPTPTELYYLLRALGKYSKNMMGKSEFISFNTLYTSQLEQAQKIQQADELYIIPLAESKLPSGLLYIPFINLIGIFVARGTKDTFHLRNGIILTLIMGALIALLSVYSHILIFILFPITFGIGYIYQKAYRMPFIYDIYLMFASIGHIFHHSKKLHNTTKSETHITKNIPQKKPLVEKLEEKIESSLNSDTPQKK